MTHNVEPALTRTDILHPKLGLEELRHRLQAAGLRPTRQRLALAHLLFGNGDRHFTAEQLFQEALEQKYPPSFATNPIIHLLELCSLMFVENNIY